MQDIERNTRRAPAGVSTGNKIMIVLDKAAIQKNDARQIVQASVPPEPDDDKPQNGLAGLKHWRSDMIAGLIVALVSVPLSLGIALASGAPPICGIWSEIIAGLIFPLLGGAYVTISGPAAGLAPVLYSSIATLGNGNMETGYKLILPVIMFAGMVQLVLTYFKLGKFSYLIPRTAIQGMLCSIGLLIIAKQIPNFIGYKFEAHEFFGLLAETPSHFAQMNIHVFVISVACLAVLFVLPKTKIQWLKFIPPHLCVVLLGIGLGQLFHIAPKYLISLPSNPIEHGITFPDFFLLFSQPTLIPTVILSVLALTFVDGCESLATIYAVDQIDPYHRKSNPHRTLFAMGISNICSSLIGGLTIIPGIIKSTTNIVAGGKTAWVNFYNALFLIAFLLLFHEQIGLIPVGALSAVLVHIGFKLAGPEKWLKIAKLGWDQMAVFTTTVLVTVCSDLLVGIACGIVVKVAILMMYSLRADRSQSLWRAFSSIFRNPVSHVKEYDGAAEIHFTGPVTCFNNLAVRDALETTLSKQHKIINLCFDPSVKVVDHSSGTFLSGFQADCKRSGAAQVSLLGLEQLATCAKNEHSLRYRTAALSR